MDARTRIRWLTFGMFFMFAMTTDSIGVIIPQVIAEYHLNFTQASYLQLATMFGIAMAGLFLGHWADRHSRAFAIRVGLGVFAFGALAMVIADRFNLLILIILLAGLGIGVFKTGALALVADLEVDNVAYTSTMNLLEGFFGVGAIVGPLLVTVLAQHGLSWRGLYVLAAVLCAALLAASMSVRYPAPRAFVEATTATPEGAQSRVALLADPMVWLFSSAAFLYVAVECSIYVWMPTLLSSLAGQWMAWAGFALPVFFGLRALGRFVGVWAVERVGWERAMMIAAVLIAGCFVASTLSLQVAAVSLPASGLFMSILYPTLNSKAIACARVHDKGRVAGIVLFFTCAGAFLGPVAMGAVSDRTGDPRAGFLLATAASLMFAVWAIGNLWRKPAAARLGE
jgi:fucose permease